MSQARESQHQALFKPIAFGPHTLRNRIVMSPMTRQRSPGGVPGEQSVAYYQRRAEGGVGLIVTEGTCIGHPAASGYNNVPDLFGPQALEGWKRVVEAVHQAGARIVPQLWHVGPIRRLGQAPDPLVPGYGPSEISEGGEVQVKAMSLDDIEQVIEAYAQAARDARAIGFDGVEIHGAHEYLIDSFIWSQTNQRDDDYGGSLANRTRLAARIVQAVREATSPDYPIMFRFSQWKISDYGARIVDNAAELKVFLDILVEAGVDVFDVSTRRFWEPAFEGSSDSLAAWTRRLSGKPVMMVGSVGLDKAYSIAQLRGNENPDAGQADLAPVVGQLQSGAVDLVALGRMLLADPQWPTKVFENRLAEINRFDREAMQTEI
ncbi:MULTISPECIES: NADH:flavin oxidoreductase [unclassified Pseudomonas]|uniref:NADH:flavin oxidoreductase n=1 Tax=unclassified Pseudomonas TaxID=196821 RepID=UPI000BA38938|nr:MULTISPECIES: NADH:flavin oxidoreductase [unclassified Pseudomonas]MCU1722628.1 NADH:flavin oxidoreductase [Pseudomonas sp. 5P_5.1_Bac1]MCU1734104.1 NADH:flavin oxidoreductase [Pseudomonas sp. 20P_3.2_Bac4]MCU1743349.1 NADH:flavin oxidoreductase [Pseudomonas sp. 20P_3.2_Bac5]